MQYLGVDPGIHGGLAIIEDCTIIATMAMPAYKVKNKSKVDAIAIREFLIGYQIEEACVEEVHSMPGQGVASTFSFGRSAGVVIGAVEAILGKRVVEARPQAWKKLVLAGTAKDKVAAINHCKTNYPSANLRASSRCRTDHDGIADAICIAEYIYKKSELGL